MIDRIEDLDPLAKERLQQIRDGVRKASAPPPVAMGGTTNVVEGAIDEQTLHINTQGDERLERWMMERGIKRR